MSSRSDFQFQFGRSPQRAAADRDPARPMRILVLGDFSGRRRRGPTPEGDELAKRVPVSVDIDNLDQVIARWAPSVALPLSEGAAESTVIQFQSLDDFHPDQLVEQLDVFQSLRAMRRQLADPATFQQAAAQFADALAIADESEPQGDIPPSDVPQVPPAESQGQMLSRLLGDAPAQSTPAAHVGHAEVADLIRRVVQPHVVPDAAPRQQQFVDAVDTAIGCEMRRILHHPEFQALESLWRGVAWLLGELELGSELQLWLMDVGRDELQRDLAAAVAGDDLALSGLYRRVVEQQVQSAGGQPWSLIVGQDGFGPSDEDCQLLAALGYLASHAGGPFLAAGNSQLLGCESIVQAPDPVDWKGGGASEGWQALRRSPAAPWIGLAMPRVLLRLPYGQRTDEVERFAFEELTTPAQHEQYLWGNPALACALLIGKSFQERGWSLEPGDHLELGDLPAHSYERDGEMHLQACSEVRLSERAAQAILDVGPMPWMSYLNRNAIRLLRFQSLADPPQPLAGPWQ